MNPNHGRCTVHARVVKVVVHERLKISCRKACGFESRPGHQNYMNDVTIGRGSLAGRGVYAARDFKKDEVVISYTLKPLTPIEYGKLSEDEKMFTHSHRGQIYLYSEPERYVNHSSHPNVYQDLVNHCDYAARDIKKGEMITCDATKDDIPNV